ncbi:MAG TPA: hypothetical protein VMR41_00380 [Patescibacteria group bacterium]|nr:hypothetical protein [Patescibacteria group bacterium]
MDAKTPPFKPVQPLISQPVSTPSTETYIPTPNNENNHSNNFKKILIFLGIIAVIEIIGGIYYFEGDNVSNILKSGSNQQIVAVKNTPTPPLHISPTSASQIATPKIQIPTSTLAPTLKLSPTFIALPTPTSAPKINVLPGWQLLNNSKDNFYIQTPSAYVNYDPTPDNISVQATSLPLTAIEAGYMLNSDDVYSPCTSDTDANQQLNAFVQETIALKKGDKFNSSTTTILGKQISGVVEDTSGITNTQYPNHYYYYICVNNKLFYTSFAVNGNSSITSQQKSTVDQILGTLNVN